MNFIRHTAMVLARASDGNPILTTATVILFMLLFNVLEANVEKLIFGERFEHWLDPIFISAAIAYSAYAVYACAVFNSNKKGG